MRDVLLERVCLRLLGEGKGLDPELMKVFDALLPTGWASATFREGELWKFVVDNADAWRRVLEFGTPKALPSQGAVGLAMSLGDKVLKLQLVGKDLGTTGDVFYDALVSNSAIAPYVPMVYDHGTMEVPGTSRIVVEWHVVERVEALPGDLCGEGKAMENIVGMLFDCYLGSEVCTAESVRGELSGDVAEVESRMRLRGPWLENLVKAYGALMAAGLEDLHAGNVGFRRNTGMPVFFDV